VRRLLPLLAATTLLSCAPGVQDSWWSHVRWLADDARRGRETGTPDYLAAAQYVAHEFQSAGALPAGSEGYFQPVRFISRRILEPQCFVALVRGGRADTLALGDDVTISTSLNTADSVDAGAVFAGYGLELPEAGLTDLDGLDLRGKIAVILRGAPATVPSTVAAHAQSSGERWRRLRERGAIGLVTIPDPAAPHVPWERGKLSRFDAGLTFADSSWNERTGQELGLTVNPARAERLFEGSGHTFAEVVAASHARKPVPRFPLPCHIRARVRVDRRMVESPNVIGIIPGSDPALRGESIVLSAHLDHLGVGAPIAGDSIYNGAMDNASGVATLIEIAHAIHALPHPPRRSIVLLAVTGEEKGLLGSRAFALNPPSAVGRMVADLNLDMFLPIVPLRAVVAFGVEESELGDWFKAIADSSGIKVEPDPEPEQTIFVRSDQYNLVRAGVPSLFITFGDTGDSTLDRRFHEWMRDRYHAPSDDLRQPVDLEAAIAFNRLLFRVCLDVADREERPRWKAESFFRRFARDPSEVAPPAAPAARPRA
jgi:Zn-dependent M28 family amino/carboxypeptidase